MRDIRKHIAYLEDDSNEPKVGLVENINAPKVGVVEDFNQLKIEPVDFFLESSGFLAEYYKIIKKGEVENVNTSIRGGRCVSCVSRNAFAHGKL